MATMATSHQLSVLTNSSVKPPLNPSTGLSSSLHERPVTVSGRFSGIFYDDYDEEREGRGEVLDTSSLPKFANTADPASIIQLSNLSDEEFYAKLLQLKNEQRKLLQKCEEVYIEKHRGVIEPTFPVHNRKGTDEETTRHKAERPESPLSAEIRESLVTSQRCTTPPLREGGITPPLSAGHSPANRDQQSRSGKPPTGRFVHTIASRSVTSPKYDLLERPSSAPISREHAQSLDDLRERAYALRRSIESGDDDDDYIPDDTVSEPYKPKDISLAMSRIEDMWDNFQIDDYAPRRSGREPRISSATITRKEKKKEDNWRHRLTVPEPFTMTLREERKEKRKTKTQIEFEEKQLAREMAEEDECIKQFKATPVPAHVYLPLYDEIAEKAEHRRRHVRAMSAELLKSQEKPFNFVKREADKKQHQLMTRQCNQQRQSVQKETFKAKPVPEYIFDKSVDDKLMEEEEYRKIRMKMRSEELMRSASLPPNMEARQKMLEQKKKEQKLKSKRKSQKSHSRPRISHNVPNYDALYRQFQDELQRRKCERESTVAQPFRLESHRVLSSRQKEKIRRDIEKESEDLKENRWPYKTRTKPRSLGYLSMSLDSLPSKSTKSADVRASQNRNKLTEMTQRELREIESEKKRRVREMKLRRYLQERLPQETPRDSPIEKKKKYKDAERARMEEYERELEEMKNRVQRRPLLFEQESQTNAKKSAEKKFNATLRSVGLDEDFIESRGSRSASVRDDYTDEYDDDFEDTYVKRDDTYTKRPMSPMEA